MEKCSFIVYSLLEKFSLSQLASRSWAELFQSCFLKIVIVTTHKIGGRKKMYNIVSVYTKSIIPMLMKKKQDCLDRYYQKISIKNSSLGRRTKTRPNAFRYMTAKKATDHINLHTGIYLFQIFEDYFFN